MDPLFERKFTNLRKRLDQLGYRQVRTACPPVPARTLCRNGVRVRPPPRVLSRRAVRQPLGLETVPLVEALFSDLVHTTDSLKNYKVPPPPSPPPPLPPC